MHMVSFVFLSFPTAFSTPLQYLAKKYLKRQQLRDYLHVVAPSKNVYEVRFMACFRCHVPMVGFGGICHFCEVAEESDVASIRSTPCAHVVWSLLCAVEVLQDW